MHVVNMIALMVNKGCRSFIGGLLCTRRCTQLTMS
jgi:hypothetical protein